MPIVKINDINMYYEICGEGEPLVVIWGISGEVSPFVDYLDIEMGKKYKIVFFDSRGTGRTDKPDEPYSIEIMAQDTVGLMDAIGIKSANFLGISMGSRIALVIAAKYPDRVRSLILNVAAARSPNKDDPQAVLSFERLQTMITQLGFLEAMGKYPPSIESFMRQFNALKEFDGMDLLGKIIAPTLIVNGTKDNSTQIKCAEQLSEGISDSRLILVEEDHLFIRTKPDLLVMPIIEFLEKVDAKTEEKASQPAA
jgi:pimeloyl-ACP methyl ester carboxylesterase